VKGKGSPRQQPIGRCIYCGFTSPDPSELTREHILPKGLGGTDTLLKATCANCASITSETERVFIRDTLWVLRSLAGHKSGMRLPDTNKVAILPVLLPPSLLQGPGAPRNETFQLQVLTAGIKGTLPKPVEIRESKFIVDPTNFSRVLAKIAHGYCIKRFGCETFEPFLPDIILGKIMHPPDIWVYVGGADTDRKDSRAHFIDIQELDAHGERLLSVHIKLFAQLPVPSYHIIAGRIL
jgi:hypothetical protein